MLLCSHSQENNTKTQNITHKRESISNLPINKVLISSLMPVYISSLLGRSLFFGTRIFQGKNHEIPPCLLGNSLISFHGSDTCINWCDVSIFLFYMTG